jgi:diadenosine tetraphosphate (Ap4A) HIT family hydrolase
VLVSHLVTPEALGRAGSAAYLGHLFVEPRRHAPGLADLTDVEARRVGWWTTRASRALREVAGAEHVYAAVIGDAVPHLHVHLLPRFPGTPREYLVDQGGRLARRAARHHRRDRGAGNRAARVPDATGDLRAGEVSPAGQIDQARLPRERARGYDS